MTKKSAKKRKKQNAVSSFGQDPFIEEIEKNVQPEDPNIIYKQDLIVSRDEIGGLENVLKEIDKIARYAKFEKLYTLFGIRKNPHILLHGPPGTGKTYVAKYAAKKIDAAYMELNLTEHLSMWHGMTERGVIGQLAQTGGVVGEDLVVLTVESGPDDGVTVDSKVGNAGGE